MSNFLRGGQVTAHRFRMMLQVMRIILRVTLVVIVITVYMTFKNNVTSYDWQLVPAIIKKYTFTDINPDKFVVYKNKWGIEVGSSIRNLQHNEEFQYVEWKFVRVFWMSVKSIIWVIAGSLIFSILFFWSRGRSLQANNELRGSFLLTESELLARANRHNSKLDVVKQYKIASIPYPATGRKGSYTPGEQSHTLILGSTGSGKTKIIQDLVRQIEERKTKAIIVDIKGDYISHFYNASRGDIILNPLDERGSNWNFFCETDVLRGFDTIAKALISDDSRDPFWSNAARQVFSELSRIYNDDTMSLAEFADKIVNTSSKDLEKLLANTPAKYLVDSTADKTVACVLMMLSIYLAPFRLYRKKDKVFSISQWIKDHNQNNFLFISSLAEAKEILNPLVQMQLTIAINALCSINNNAQPLKKQIWFIIDELPYFDQGLPKLKDGLTMSRSFGGAFVLGAQDMSSLSKIYSHDLARVIANNCRNKLIMNVDDSYTAKWCSELLGDGEVEEWHEGLSYGAHSMRDGVSSNKTRRLHRTVLPAEFAQLRTGEGYLKLPELNPALIKFKDYYITPRTKGLIEDESLKQILAEEEKKAKEKRIEVEQMMVEKNSINKVNNTDTKETTSQENNGPVF